MTSKTYNNRDFERILSNNGWRLNRQKASHKMYQNEKGQTLTIGGVKYNKMIMQRLIKEYDLKVD